MNVERVQIHVDGERVLEQDALTPGTPVNELSASSPDVWATPGSFLETEKLYSFREIISLPALNIEAETKLSNSVETTEMVKGVAQSSAAKEASVYLLECTSNDVDNNHVAMNGSFEDDVFGTPMRRLDQSVSPLIAPPNTPQVVEVENSPSESVLSPESADVTVYEKTPLGTVYLGHVRSSYGVKIVAAIEKTGTQRDSVSPNEKIQPKIPRIVLNRLENGASASRTYVVPEAESVVEVVKSASVVSACATPFVADAVDGVAIQVVETHQPNVLNASNDRSPAIVDGFQSDSEALFVPEHDCEELLGSLLVRPCPSMRPHRKRFAKGFLVGFLIMTVLLVVAMIVVNRMR